MSIGSVALANAVVEQLLANGLRHAVVSPGSRNAPLSLALARAADAGHIHLHVHIDERSAGFFALGLAKSLAAPVVLSCTSGTAVANFLPAVVEANYAQVPLLVVTADRPSGAVELGASQTISQSEIFGIHVRSAQELSSDADSKSAYATVNDIWVAMLGNHRGPAHLNLCFAEPLVPSSASAPWPEIAEVAGVALPHEQPSTRQKMNANVRGVIVLGDLPEHHAQLRELAVDFATTAQWPLLVEPTGAARTAAVAIRHHALVADDFLDEVEVLITVGRFGLNRHLKRLALAAKTHICVQPSAQPTNPFGTATSIVAEMPVADGQAPAPWLAQWQQRDVAMHAQIHEALGAYPEGLTGMHVARQILAAAPRVGAQVFAAASRSIRDCDLMADFTAPRVWANLGVNGIDGLISTARGISVGLDTPIIAMLGDIAFLHDHNGLLSSPFESQPDVTFVVVDDNGGAIFSDLEQGAPEFAPWFERVFGTPHGHDLAAMSRALGIPTTVVTTASELDAALATPQGLSVVVVKAASRESSHEFRMSLRNGATHIAHAAE